MQEQILKINCPTYTCLLLLCPNKDKEGEEEVVQKLDEQTKSILDNEVEIKDDEEIQNSETKNSKDKTVLWRSIGKLKAIASKSKTNIQSIHTRLEKGKDNLMSKTTRKKKEIFREQQKYRKSTSFNISFDDALTKQQTFMNRFQRSFSCEKNSMLTEVTLPSDEKIKNIVSCFTELPHECEKGDHVVLYTIRYQIPYKDLPSMMRLLCAYFISRCYVNADWLILQRTFEWEIHMKFLAVLSMKDYREQCLNVLLEIAVACYIAAFANVDIIEGLKTTATSITQTAAQNTATLGIETAAQVVGNAVAGAAISAVVDVAVSSASIYLAKRQKDEGHISEKEFNTKIKKTVCESSCKFVGGTTGSIIGQVLIPVPVVGAFVGGFCGSLIGAGIGKGITYGIFDRNNVKQDLNEDDIDSHLRLHKREFKGYVPSIIVYDEQKNEFYEKQFEKCKNNNTWKETIALERIKSAKKINEKLDVKNMAKVWQTKALSTRKDVVNDENVEKDGKNGVVLKKWQYAASTLVHTKSSETETKDDESANAEKQDGSPLDGLPSRFSTFEDASSLWSNITTRFKDDSKVKTTTNEKINNQQKNNNEEEIKTNENTFTTRNTTLRKLHDSFRRKKKSEDATTPKKLTKTPMFSFWLDDDDDEQKMSKIVTNEKDENIPEVILDKIEQTENDTSRLSNLSFQSLKQTFRSLSSSPTEEQRTPDTQRKRGKKVKSESFDDNLNVETKNKQSTESPNWRSSSSEEILNIFRKRKKSDEVYDLTKRASSTETEKSSNNVLHRRNKSVEMLSPNSISKETFKYYEKSSRSASDDQLSSNTSAFEPSKIEAGSVPEPDSNLGGLKAADDLTYENAQTDQVVTNSLRILTTRASLNQQENKQSKFTTKAKEFFSINKNQQQTRTLFRREESISQENLLDVTTAKTKVESHANSMTEIRINVISNEQDNGIEKQQDTKWWHRKLSYEVTRNSSNKHESAKRSHSAPLLDERVHIQDLNFNKERKTNVTENEQKQSGGKGNNNKNSNVKYQKDEEEKMRETENEKKEKKLSSTFKHFTKKFSFGRTNQK